MDPPHLTICFSSLQVFDPLGLANMFDVKWLREVSFIPPMPNLTSYATYFAPAYIDMTFGLAAPLAASLGYPCASLHPLCHMSSNPLFVPLLPPFLFAPPLHSLRCSPQPSPKPFEAPAVIQLSSSFAYAIAYLCRRR